MKNKLNAIQILSVLVLFGVVMAGCSSLPAVKPFANATAALRPAYNESFDVVASQHTDTAAQLNDIDTQLWSVSNKDLLDGVIKGYEKAATEIEAEKKFRLKTVDALIKYSDSLAAIVSAGNEGAESAEKVAGSVNTLLATFGGAANAAVPGSSEIPKVVVGVAKELYKQYALHRAAKSLKEAIDNAGPIIDKLTEALSEDPSELLADLSTSNDSIKRAQI